MFDFFKKLFSSKEKIVKTNQTQKHLDWKQSRPLQNLIAYFLKPRQINNLYSFQKWTNPLGEPVERAIQHLIDTGLIIPADKIQSLIGIFTVAELKEHLRASNLPVSGAKIALVTRLLEKAPEKTNQLLQNSQVYICSVEGVAIAQAYEQYEKQRLEDARKNSAQAILDQRLHDAGEIVNNYRKHCIFPSGLNITISTNRNDNDNLSQTNIWYSTEDEVLKHIFANTPKVALKNGWDKIPNGRFVAAMSYLWGNAIEAGIECDEKTQDAASAFVSHAYFLTQIEQYRRIGIKYVRFMTPNDDCVCTYCKKMANRKFKINEVPELPFEYCTGVFRCRCKIISV